MFDDIERGRELARRYGSEFVDLRDFRISSEMLGRVPVELMYRYNFVPLEDMQNGKLAIAIADPSQLLMIDEIELLLRRSIEVRVSPLRQIANLLRKTDELHSAEQS
jgi:hypothetical protein